VSIAEQSLVPVLGASDVVDRAAVVPPAARWWLFHPLLDAVVMCGGLTLLVLPFAFLVSPVVGGTVFMALNLVCNYPHYMATNYRIYGRREQIRRYRLFAIYVTSAIVFLALASHLLVGPWVNLLVIAYLFLGPYHYTGQNYGIALMYARRGGIDVHGVDKRLLYGAGVAFMLSYLLLITVRPLDIPIPGLTGLHLPAAAARVLHGSLVGVGIACAAAALWRLRRTGSWPALAPVIALLAAQFLWFALPSAIVLFNTRIGLGGLSLASFVLAINFLHCAQYLGVTAYYTQRERAAAGDAFHLGRYFLVLIIGGAVLWSVAMRCFSEAFAVDYGISMLVLSALINIHHYVLDGAIWKLRDGRIARLLVAPAADAAAGPPPAGGTRGRSPGALRGLVWTAVAAIALAAFVTDVMRGHLLLRAAGLRDAQQWDDASAAYRSALSVNGNAADAMEGLAAAAMQAGDWSHAAEHWAAAVALNPIAAHLRDGLAEAYLRLGRIDEAVTQLEQAVALAPQDEIAVRLLARAEWAKGNRGRARELIAEADGLAAEAARQRDAL
jgi:tetratricopeptide (TPR) repeat protein